MERIAWLAAHGALAVCRRGYARTCPAQGSWMLEASTMTLEAVIPKGTKGLPSADLGAHWAGVHAPWQA